MAGGLVIVWWMWALFVPIVLLLATCAVLILHERDIYPLREVTQLIRRPWFEVALILCLVGGMVQYGATKGTNGTDRAEQPMRYAPPSAQAGDRSALDGPADCREVTNLCFTEIAPLSNSVRLSLAWPTNLFCGGTTLDFFSKVGSLTNAWNWVAAEYAMAGSTNLEVELPYPIDTPIPTAMFYMANDRYTSAVTMADPDRDGIPNVYELHHGTNPYVADSELVPRLTVGSHGDYPTIEAALAESESYSVVTLEGETFEMFQPIVMPPHPVLLEGPEAGYAVFRSSAEIGAVMLTDGQDERTLFRNLIVELRAKRNFQAGFWVGGNTPWTGQGGAATFENVRIRAPYPGVEYFGWLFYRDEAGASRLSECTMNAAGSTWAYGITMFNAASNVIEDCAFLNMPTNAIEHSPVAVLIRDSTNGVVALEVPEARPDLSWAGYPFSASYDLTADSDGDGIPDYDEVLTYDTDPWLSDSDGDGIDDENELALGTDPRDISSHPQRFDICVTNTAIYADMTNYVFSGSVEGWVTNLLFACSGSGCVTNVYTNTLFGVTAMGAFRDLNRTGTYEPSEDILQMTDVAGFEAAKTVRFAFGDVDGDGVSDVQERFDETDPYSALSVKIRKSVSVSNSNANGSITNVFCISTSASMSDAVWQARFTGGGSSTVANVLATNGNLYAIVYRDLNRNGSYDEGVDALVIKPFKNSDDEVKIQIGDADGDGEKDSQELLDGTDPLDAKNYKLDAYVFCESMDASNVLTNYVQLSKDISIWDAAVPCSWFVGNATTNFPVFGVVTNGVFYVKYFRDVNKNGEYDEGIDIYKATQFGSSENHERNGVLLGDYDQDGVLDSEEIADRTDPFNRLDYRFNLDLTVGGVFSTSNRLSAAVMMGGEPVFGPVVTTGNVFSCCLTNLHTDCGAKVKVRFWDDANHDGVRDLSEPFTEQAIAVDGRDTVAVFRLPLGAFDGDGDSIPDYWELQHGLSPENAADALVDADGDGLINLHEFVAGCDPNAFDGTNTAMYSFCHSVDDRIKGVPRKSMNTYSGSVYGSPRNRNCWAYGIDVSSASPYNSSQWGFRAGALISKRHVIFAKHYPIGIGATMRFVGMDDVNYDRTLVESRHLVGTDIVIGLLSSDLPDAVIPAVILPADYSHYIGDAKRLPMLMYDFSEHSIVTDSNSLAYHTIWSDGLVPVDQDRLAYFEAVESGDSGDPKYLISGTSAILTCTLKTFGTGDSGSGPFVSFYKKRIQAMMDYLCPGYELEEFDFSKFRRLDDEE